MPFNVIGYYDISQRLPSQLIVKSINESYSFEVKRYTEIKWDSIDTLIIGHLHEINMYGKKNIKKYLLDECLKKNINVFAFDKELFEEYEHKFSEKKLNLYVPCKNYNEVVKKDGKLYNISTPIIGIWGTSTVQGKFTLQLFLRKLFIKNGYTVGQIGTEPTSQLFGMNDTFPFGYASTMELKDKDLIESINYSLYNIDKQQNDIILVGSQSGTIPAIYNNIEQLHLTQIEFLLGTNPDIVVLCVNLFDDLTYIKRTIATIENLVDCKIISIAISPLTFDESNKWDIMSSNKIIANKEVLKSFKTKIKNNFGLKSYIIGNENEMNLLFDQCIDTLS